MNDPHFRELWLPLALGFALIAIWVSHLISARRAANELTQFGPPPFNPLMMGLINLVPGLGLHRMGWPLKKVLLHSSLNYLVIACALVWPSIQMGSRVKLIVYALIAAALVGERVATEAWKSKLNESTPPA